MKGKGAIELKTMKYICSFHFEPAAQIDSVIKV